MPQARRFCKVGSPNKIEYILGRFGRIPARVRRTKPLERRRAVAGIAGQLVSHRARHRGRKAEACTTVSKNGQNTEKIPVPELTALAPIVSDTVDANLKNLSQDRESLKALLDSVIVVEIGAAVSANPIF